MRYFEKCVTSGSSLHLTVQKSRLWSYQKVIRLSSLIQSKLLEIIVDYIRGEQLQKMVYDLLAAQKPSVVAYTSDNIENRLGSGEVAAHFWWDGNTLRLANSGANVEYAAPREGLVGWLDSFVVPAGAANVDNAKSFIDFMSTVENATIQYNYYAHSAPVEIDESKAVYTPENAPALFPQVPVVFAQACSPAAQDLVTKVWTDLLQ